MHFWFYDSGHIFCNKGWVFAFQNPVNDLNYPKIYLYKKYNYIPVQKFFFLRKFNINNEVTFKKVISKIKTFQTYFESVKTSKIMIIVCVKFENFSCWDTQKSSLNSAAKYRIDSKPISLWSPS